MKRVCTNIIYFLIALLIFVLCSCQSNDAEHNTLSEFPQRYCLICDVPISLCGENYGVRANLICIPCAKKVSAARSEQSAVFSVNFVREPFSIGHYVHTLSPATCDAAAICRYCGAEIGEPLSHIVTRATCTTVEYCELCYRKLGEKLEHIWEYDGCGKSYICSLCGASSIEIASHDYVQADHSAPTCVKPGDVLYSCVRCEDSYSEILSPLGHTRGEDDLCSICNQYGVLLDVPHVSQTIQYPNGCESICAVMALRYMGIEVSVDEFIDDYLPKSPLCYYSLGADPEYYYIGDPRDSEGLYCFAPAIQNACEKAIGDTDNMRAIVTEVQSISDLCDTYIDHGVPVIVWATKYMIGKLYYADAWWIVNETGEKHQLLANLHCFLLTGYDEWYYYFNDPLVGQVKYSRYYSELSFSELGKRAVVIINEQQ